jgi:hypothetical protein
VRINCQPAFESEPVTVPGVLAVQCVFKSTSMRLKQQHVLILG